MTDLKPYQTKVLDLMTQQELEIARLYKLLAEKHPDHAGFWNTLQQEELQHAQWLEYLARKAVSGSVLFSEDRTRTYTVQTFLDYLKRSIDKVTAGSLSFREALALVQQVEDSLLERNVFNHFQGDAPELTTTLNKLRDETKKHAAEIKNLLLKLKTAS